MDDVKVTLGSKGMTVEVNKCDSVYGKEEYDSLYTEKSV